MRLTDYQRGSIFGLVLAALAFAFAFGTATDSQHANDVSQQAAHSDSKQRQEPELWWRPWWQWVTHDASGFFTFALCGIGGAQAVLFWWQLHLIREGLTDTEDAAKAAKEQAQLARESLVASHRAWIKVDQIEVESDLVWHAATGSAPMHATVSLSVNVSNIGGTPATNVNTHMEAIGGYKGVSDKIKVLVARKTDFPVAWTRMLLPGQSYRRSWGFKVTAIDEDGLPAQPVIIGRTAYRIAQDADVRVTAFAFMLFECEVEQPTKFVNLIFPGTSLPRDRIGWSGVGGEYAT